MTADELLAYCLAKPGAWQDAPWDDGIVAKVGPKIFAFLGAGTPAGVGLKCGATREVADEWLHRYPDDVTVMPYIGRSGWNSLRTGGAIPDDEILTAIDDSYATVVSKLPKKDRPLGAGRIRSAAPLPPVDPQTSLQQLRLATDDLLGDIDGLTDADARAPSPLPGWTRGHVLTHLARNAEGSTRLLVWARTGVPGYQYESHQARAAEIDQGAGRPAKALIADVRAQADAFFDAADGMPEQCWQRTVTFTGGHDVAAGRIPSLRLGEVHIHTSQPVSKSLTAYDH